MRKIRGERSLVNANARYGGPRFYSIPGSGSGSFCLPVLLDSVAALHCPSSQQERPPTSLPTRGLAYLGAAGWLVGLFLLQLAIRSAACMLVGSKGELRFDGRP